MLIIVTSLLDDYLHMAQTIHFYVSGRVQGVFFRMKTKQQADLYGLTGWVRNLSDGRVEGMASGDEKLLKEFSQWLQQGPEMARVLKLEVEEIEPEEFKEFSIR